MSVDNPDKKASVAPAPLSSALKSRLLAAMETASAVTTDFRQEEALLAMLKPAPLSARFRRSIKARMEVEAAVVMRRGNLAVSYWKAASIAAMLGVAFCTSVGFYLYSDRTYAEDSHIPHEDVSDMDSEQEADERSED